jgi:hypothetical protein
LGVGRGRRRRISAHRHRGGRGPLGEARGSDEHRVFPSGRAFGCLVYPPREDGLPTYNEGYLFEGDGALVPARVVEAPWLRRMMPRGERVRVVLETEHGRRETISGETIASVFAAIPVTADAAFPILHQSIVHYTWGSESTNGMMERSTLPQHMDSAGQA